ncbi:MAG: UvrD-helicase domain-containing protein [Burkholderiaceae bacterium]|nr:UvrD-helicase domain-containing protein [Burkholderiaceae bacterium]
MSDSLAAHPVFDAGILDGLHLLEADAGTGKTWTIAGLVVRALVERGLGIEQVLVVTFTNAATAELGARIRQRIAQLGRLLDDRIEGRDSAVDEPFCVAWAARLDDAAARRARSLLRIALARADEMAVYTIHGYCQRVIDEHALSIGVPGGLPVSAESTAPELDRLPDWWRAQAREASPARLLAFTLAGLDPDTLRAAVRAIAAQPLARVAPAAADWRGVECELAEARAELSAALASETDALLDWLGTKGNADGTRFRVAWAKGWLEALRVFCADPHPQALPEAVGKLAVSRFGERVPPFSIPLACERLARLAESLAQLPARVALEIATAARATRQDALAQARALGFDDLLRLVHDALADPDGGAALAAALRERHPMALIDECQDTDALQWAIFRRIYVEAAPAGEGAPAPPALVLVGDPKQAIYAFRGADVYSYLDAREAVRRIHRLGENQRSSRALIASVNALFGRERPFLVGEIGFTDTGVGARPRRALVAGDEAGDEAARAALTVALLRPDPDAGWLNVAAAQRQSIEACVGEIGRLLDGRAQLGGRPLRPADIAVLVNTHRQGAGIKRALAAAGIGAAEVSRESVLGTLECNELLRVVAAIADPADAGLLRAALATTLLGEDAASLAALDADSGRALAAASRFARAREDWLRRGPIAALRRLIRDEGVAQRLAAIRDGDRRLTNLMHLIELLGDDEEARRGPQPALRAWARRRASGAPDERETEELRLESDEDLVRILTVHKSKGLEFPVVFLPFAWAGRGPAAAAGPRTWHERTDGGGWRAVLDFAPTQQAARQCAAEFHAEALRAMYVALTRAEQRCYLFWGAASGAQFSPLAWLLAGLDPAEQRDWRPNSKTPPPLDEASIGRALDAWRGRACAAEPAALRIVDAPTLASAAVAPACIPASGTVPAGVAAETPPAPSALVARPWRTTIAAPLVTSSFSAIVSSRHGADGGGTRAQDAVERPDHDQQPLPTEPLAAADEPAEAATAAEASIRFRFPAGSQAGTCLHGMLEDARFDAPFDHAAIADRLARGGYRRFDPAEVAQWLGQVLATPLRAAQGEILRLPEVPASRQVRELDFLLAAHAVSDRVLIDAVGAEFGFDATTGSARWSGFLRGFIDLVFEHRGRYYLLDWKSNHLGASAACYAAAPLAGAMRANAYPLQACLYALALHRWLRRRLRGYDYERHCGGALYVFLRGAGLDVPGTEGAGVHALRPSARLVDTLDRLFAASPAQRSR